MVIGRKGQGSIVLLMMLCAAPLARSQESATPNPPSATPDVTAPAADTSTPAAAPQTQSPPAAKQPAPLPAPKPKGKLPYTGPNTVIELPPTPVLDEEGKQRLDPEGNPMFNDPVKQQRDKHGHPLFDNSGKPVMQTAKDLGYDETGKKITVKHEKPAKTVAVAVSHGTLTVDGMIGKAQLNYDIKDFRFIYLYAPWVGTVVVSNGPFPGAIAQKDAFNDKTLTITVEEHTFQVYSEKQLLSKKPEAAYVLVDRNFQLPTQTPVMGYGATLRQPYAWPGAKLVASTKTAPPIPEALRPTPLLPPCPAGQMRKPGPPVLPGEVRDDPCVPISTVAVAPAHKATPTPPVKEASAAPSGKPAENTPPPQR
jgi:hypothetical protein